MSIIAKKILKFILKSLLIPFITKNMDKWTTILNKKINNFLEN